MNWIKPKFLTVFAVYLIAPITILYSFDLSLRLFFGYDDYFKDQSNCKIYNEVSNFSYYRPNCRLLFKHWENDREVEYVINENGRRDFYLSKEDGSLKIASIGDSFTFGALVPIKDNYNYQAFKDITSPQYTIHNFGVGAEQATNIFNKLKTYDFSEYKYILYGLTPNDLFDYLVSKNLKPSEKTSSKNRNYSYFKSIKNWLLKTATSQFLLHTLMSFDSIYFAIYKARAPFSGYLEKEASSLWQFAFNEFSKELMSLPPRVREKMKIFILPQRAEVIAARLGKKSNLFQEEIFKICNSIKIHCFTTNIDKLAFLPESHFPVDGHLTIQGNHQVGRDLNAWVRKW
jgi:hypothetical protein